MGIHCPVGEAQRVGAVETAGGLEVEVLDGGGGVDPGVALEGACSDAVPARSSRDRGEGTPQDRTIHGRVRRKLALARMIGISLPIVRSPG